MKKASSCGTVHRMADRFLDSYDGFLLDMDGVLVRDSEPIRGGPEALARLVESGSVLLFTNNSTRSREQHANSLVRLGFDVRPDQILPTSYLAASYLFERSGAVSVWMIGEDGLRAELVAAGHRLAARPEEAEVLVVGMDRGIGYDALAEAYRAVESGARFIATNEDGTYPVPGGFLPGAGAMVGALRGMGCPPDAIIGKPSPIGFEMALQHLGLAADRVVMIGDRLETDILGAQDAGLDTALVLSGVSTRDGIGTSGIRPTWLADDLAALVRGDGEPAFAP